MDPASKEFRFGAGGETFVDPAIACVMLVVAIFIFALPRKHVISALLPAAILIPMDQVIVVASLHFTMLRIVILLAWMKLIGTKSSSNLELPAGGMNAIDKAVIFYAVTSVITFSLLWQEWGHYARQQLA